METAPEHHMLCRWGVEAHPAGQANGAEASLREFASTDAAAGLEHGVALGARTWDAFLKRDGVAGRSRSIAPSVTRSGSAHREVPCSGPWACAPEHDFVTYEYLGNTGTAALPVAAALAEERGFIEPGHQGRPSRHRQWPQLHDVGSGLVSTLYPFDPHYHDVAGHRLHYVDEGSGEARAHGPRQPELVLPSTGISSGSLMR